MREASSITSPIVGNNTPVFLVRDPLKFPDFIHTQKRHPRTNLRVQHLCAMRCQKLERSRGRNHQKRSTTEI